MRQFKMLFASKFIYIFEKPPTPPLPQSASHDVMQLQQVVVLDKNAMTDDTRIIFFGVKH